MGCQAIVGCAARAAQQARACNHGSYETDNTATLSSHVSPYNGQLVEGLHEDILFHMRVLGYDLDRQEKGSSSASVFHTKKLGIVARGRCDRETGRFTILAGSTAALDRHILKNAGAMEIRAHLFGDSTKRATLEDDRTFLSPSATAVFVLGGSQNGWVEWTNDGGKTLHEVSRTTE